MHVNIDEKKLKSIIKEAVKEIFQEEKISFILNSIPFVSEEEMSDIEKFHDEPKAKNATFSEDIEI